MATSKVDWVKLIEPTIREAFKTHYNSDVVDGLIDEIRVKKNKSVVSSDPLKEAIDRAVAELNVKPEDNNFTIDFWVKAAGGLKKREGWHHHSIVRSDDKVVNYVDGKQV
jgi:hypothetical protein